MMDWKNLIVEIVNMEYPKVKIKWDGDNPTLVIPDELSEKRHEISSYVIEVWKLMGGEVVFDLEKAHHTDAERV